MQEKTNFLAMISSKIVHNIHSTKTKIVKFSPSSKKKSLVTLNASPLEEMTFLTYLGGIIDHHGGTDVDVKAKIGKTRVSFLQLKKTLADLYPQN